MTQISPFSYSENQPVQSVDAVEVEILEEEDQIEPFPVHSTGKTIEEIHAPHTEAMLEELSQKRGPVPSNALRGNVLTNPRFKNFQVVKTIMNSRKRPIARVLNGRIKLTLGNVSDDIKDQLGHLAALHAGGKEYVIDFQMNNKSRIAVIVFAAEKAAMSMAEAMSNFVYEDGRQIEAYEPTKLSD